MRRRTALLACSTAIAMAVTATAPAAVAGPDQPGTVWGWGALTGGGLADTRLSPTSVPIPGDSPVIEVGSSNSTEYALLANGTLWAWGLGSRGQLGNGTDDNSLNIAVQVEFPPGVFIAYIPVNSMPFDTGLAVDTSGRAWGWGLNGGGDLCLGDRQAFDRPVELPLPDVTALAGASNHAVYDAGGALYSCGMNGPGVLGAGPHAPRDALRPVRVKDLNGSEVTRLVSSEQNAGALLGDGQYYDWGSNGEGQLGVAHTEKSSVPVLVSLPAAVVEVAQGGSLPTNGQTLVKLANGTLYAWGNNTYHQIDAGGPGVQRTPRQIYAPAGVTYETLASGGGTSYAITTSGDVYAWGQNNYGQVGNGTTREASSPVLVAPSASLISATAKNVVIGEG